MSRHWFVIAVTGMWITSMSWLVWEKILPVMLAGPPPSNLTAYGQATKFDEPPQPIGWEIQWNNTPVGWAVSTAQVNEEGYTQFQSHAHLKEIPVDQLIPRFLMGIWGSATKRHFRINFEAESRITIDPQGRLSRLVFLVSSPDYPGDPIRVDGMVDGQNFKISFQTGSRLNIAEFKIPLDSLVGNDFSPVVNLPNLYEGQTWNVPMPSPLRMNSSVSIEVMQAKVERRETIVHQGIEVPCWLVLYRSDSGARSAVSRKPSSKLWVKLDGEVLQQESNLKDNIRLSFTKVTTEQAHAYWKKSTSLRYASQQEWLHSQSPEAPSTPANNEDSAPSPEQRQWSDYLPRKHAGETEAEADPFAEAAKLLEESTR
jgi:hypothetical protein